VAQWALFTLFLGLPIAGPLAFAKLFDGKGVKKKKKDKTELFSLLLGLWLNYLAWE
jgi:hypothetical protein